MKHVALQPLASEQMANLDVVMRGEAHALISNLGEDPEVAGRVTVRAGGSLLVTCECTASTVIVHSVEEVG